MPSDQKLLKFCDKNILYKYSWHCTSIPWFLLAPVVSVPVASGSQSSINVFFALSPAALQCPDIESMLSEHMVWRLISGQLNEFGARIMLSCSPGYYLGGRRTIKCLANATWEGLEEKSTCKSKNLITLEAILQLYSIVLLKHCALANCSFKETPQICTKWREMWNTLLGFPKKISMLITKLRSFCTNETNSLGQLNWNLALF